MHLTFQSQGLTLFMYQALNLGSSYVVGKLKVPFLSRDELLPSRLTHEVNVAIDVVLASLLVLLCVLSTVSRISTVYSPKDIYLLTFWAWVCSLYLWQFYQRLYYVDYLASKHLEFLDFGSILIHCHWCIHAHLQINFPFFCSYLCFCYLTIFFFFFWLSRRV